MSLHPFLLGVGFFWPFHDTSAAQGAGLMVVILLLLGSVPALWYLLRQRAGPRVAGPLWALLFFEVIASFYALVVPPWQMPDEPQHMVHIELQRRAGTAATQRISVNNYKGGDRALNERVQAEVIASLREANTAKLLPGARGALDAHQVPGPSELLHPPLYYQAAALATTPFGSYPLLARLAVVRTLGLVFGAWTLWACGAVGRLLWPTRPRMAEVPIAVAAGVPTFAVLAGAANSDTLANLMGAFLVLALCVAVSQRPLRWPRLLPVVIVVLVILGVLTKRTVVPLYFMIPLAALLRTRRRRFVLLAVAVGLELGLGIFLLAAPRTRLAEWQTAPVTRTYRCHQAKVGAWAICMPGAPSSQVIQNLPIQRARELRGQDVTVGAWVRADGPPTSGYVDAAADGSTRFAAALTVPSGQWQFLSAQGRVPTEARSMRVDVGSFGKGTVYADEVVLAVGQFTGPPQPGPTPSSLRWGDAVVHNEVINGSADRANIRAPRVLPASVQNGVDGAFDSIDALTHQTGRVLAGRNVLANRMSLATSMFWATVGWTIPPAVVPIALQILLGALTVVGVGGAVAAAIIGRGNRSTPLVVLLVATAFVGTGAVLLRDVPPSQVVLVSGRYFFPSLAAIATVLAVGWRVAWSGDDLAFRRTVRISVLVLHALFLMFVLLPWLSGSRSQGTELALLAGGGPHRPAAVRPGAPPRRAPWSACRDSAGLPIRSAACLSPPSRPTTPRTARSPRPLSSESRPTSAIPRCTTTPTPIGRVSGPSRPSPSTGSTSGTPFSTGSCPSPAGS